MVYLLCCFQSTTIETKLAIRPKKQMIPMMTEDTTYLNSTNSSLSELKSFVATVAFKLELFKL